MRQAKNAGIVPNGPVLTDHVIARIIHDGSSSPTHPSPILWGRVREGGRDRRAEPRGRAASLNRMLTD